MPQNAWLCWSGGKDSAWALHVLRQQPAIRVTGLLTSVSEEEVTMHRVPLALVRRQAEVVGLPLHVVDLPSPCSNAEYEALMSRATAEASAQRVSMMAFGDLFLEDIRTYREARLAGSGIAPVFPLWRLPTDTLARDMIASGLRARVSSIDLSQLPRALAGREFDDEFLRELPAGADPCGERGEFHTFAWAGPMFREPIAIDVGETRERGGFAYTELRARG